MTIASPETNEFVVFRRWLARETDAIANETAATELGRRARRAYVDRQAVRNLLRCAETSTAVSDLLDYVKVRIARHPQWRREAFGPTLLEQLEQLRARASAEGVPAVADSAASPHLELCRLFLRQLAAAYAYSIAVDVAGPRGTTSMPPRQSARPPAVAPARRREGERRGRPAAEAAPKAEEQPPMPTAPAEPAAASADAVAEGAPTPGEPVAEVVAPTELTAETEPVTTEQASAAMPPATAATAERAPEEPAAGGEATEPVDATEGGAPEGELPTAEAPKETTE